MELRDQNGMTEREFLEAYAKKNYPRPYLTADIVLLSEGKDSVLLVRRKGHPFLGKWALPGGFANAGESVRDTALRELREETGIAALSAADVVEVGLFSEPGRDPRGWVVSGAYAAKVRRADMAPRAGDDAADAQWFNISPGENGGLVLSNGDVELHVGEGGSELAFDHGEILRAALEKAE